MGKLYSHKMMLLAYKMSYKWQGFYNVLVHWR